MIERIKDYTGNLIQTAPAIITALALNNCQPKEANSPTVEKEQIIQTTYAALQEVMEKKSSGKIPERIFVDCLTTTQNREEIEAAVDKTNYKKFDWMSEKCNNKGGTIDYSRKDHYFAPNPTNSSGLVCTITEVIEARCIFETKSIIK